MSSQPATWDDEFERGKAAVLAQDFDAARRHLAPLVESRPQHLASIFLARTELESGNQEAARRCIDRFLEKQPGNARGRILSAQLHLEKEEWDAAERECLLALEKKPDAKQAMKFLQEARAGRNAARAVELVAAIDASYPAARSGPRPPELTEAATELAELTPGPQWPNDVLQAKIAFFHNAVSIDHALANYDPHLVEKSVELGYINWPKRIQEWIRHKSVVDVGCGFGGYGMGFLVAGATQYLGLDPQMDLDQPRARNKRIREWSTMNITPREIAATIPAIDLLQGTAENLSVDETFDVISLHNVTEHLMQIDTVFSGLVGLCRPGSKLVYLHHSFHCWNGHHFAPNDPSRLDETDSDQALIYDWRHIAAWRSLPDDHYINTGLNKIRLDEIREVTERYFTIERWDEVNSNKATLARLTPEVLARVQETDPHLTERDLRVNAVFCVACPK